MSDPISKPPRHRFAFPVPTAKTDESPRGFEIEFRVTNHRIEYSFGPTALSKARLADEIEAAWTNNWPVEPVTNHKHVERLMPSGRTVAMNRYIEIVWTDKKIRTNVRKNEGDLFRRVLAYFVTILREQAAGSAPPAN